MKLIITIPDDEHFEETQKHLKKYSYNKTYTVRLRPPNLIKYEINSGGEYGSELLKNSVIKIYSKSNFKEHCKFEVIV